MSADTNPPKTSALFYYDFLTPTQIEELRAEYERGPQPAYDGVAPDTDMPTRLKIGTKRFDDKFNRPRVCPMGHYQEDMVYDHRTIAERLKA